MPTIIQLTLAPVPGTTPPAPLRVDKYDDAVSASQPDANTSVEVVDSTRLVIPALRYRLRVCAMYDAGLGSAGEATTRIATINVAINQLGRGTWYVVSRDVQNTETRPLLARPSTAPRTAARVREAVTGARVVSSDPARNGQSPTRADSASQVAPATDQIGDTFATIVLVSGIALLVGGAGYLAYRAMS